MVVGSRRLRHESCNFPPDLMDACLQLSVNLVGRGTLLTQVVDLALQTSVSVDDLAVPYQQLGHTWLQISSLRSMAPPLLDRTERHTPELQSVLLTTNATAIMRTHQVAGSPCSVGLQDLTRASSGSDLPASWDRVHQRAGGQD